MPVARASSVTWSSTRCFYDRDQRSLTIETRDEAHTWEFMVCIRWADRREQVERPIERLS